MHVKIKQRSKKIFGVIHRKQNIYVNIKYYLCKKCISLTRAYRNTNINIVIFQHI